MPFASDPVLALSPDGITFTLAEDAVYLGGQRDVWSIEAGFTTDLASIPAVASWAIPKLGAYSSAALVHDLLCVELHRAWHSRRYPAMHPREYTPAAGPRDTDAIFRRICREGGVDLVTRWLLWTGVRWGALANPARRSGWHRDAPLVLLISLLAAPVVVPATVMAVLGRVVLRAASSLARLVTR